MKKRKNIIGAIVVLIAIIAVVVINLIPTWSTKSFKAIVLEIITQPDGEVRLVVQRTTEIYGNPLNSLHISEITELLDVDGTEISIEDIKEGYSVEVTLKDSFIEETPFYYLTVYEVRVTNT